MSLDHSPVVDMECDDDYSLTFSADQQDLLTMHMLEAFMEQDAQYEALGLQEPEADESNTGENGIKSAHDCEMGNIQGDVNTPIALATPHESPLSQAVDEDEDWAAQFFEEAVVPVGEGQDSFAQNDASSNVVEAVSSIVQVACPSDQNSRSSNTLAPDFFDEQLLTDTEIQEALRLGVESYHTPSDSNNLLSHSPQSPTGASGSLIHSTMLLGSGDIQCFVQQPGQLPPTHDTIADFELSREHKLTEEDKDYEAAMKEYETLMSEYSSRDAPKSLRFFRHEDDYRKYLPQKTPARNIRGSMQQAEQPVPHVNQLFREMENQPHQSEVTPQAEKIIQQVPLNHQAMPFNVERQTVRPVDIKCQVKKPGVPFENKASQMQCAHEVDTPSGRLHMPMLQQHDPDLQYGKKSEQAATKMALIASNSTNKSVNAATFVHDHQVQSRKVSTGVTPNAKYHNKPEKIHGSSALEPNENSHMISEQQSDQGLAGVFGITLDQAKSGMRNTKAIVRNTMIEKPKPTASPTLLQYAGVKKPKSPKAKLSISPSYVQAEKEKKNSEPVTAALDGKLPTDKPNVDKTVTPTLPHMVTAEQFAAIQEAAKAKAFIFFQQTVKAEVRRIQLQTLQQNGCQAATGQNVPYPSPDQSMQMNPYHLQQQGMQTSQINHAGQIPYYPQQQHAGQAIDPFALMTVNHAAPNQVQQQGGYVAQGRSPIQGQPAPYNMPQGTYSNPQYPFLAGNQGVFYPSPQHTPPVAGQTSSYGSSMNDTLVPGHQSPHGRQMAAFNNQQQGPQMGAYPGSQQAWQFAQQGHQVQPRAYYTPLQHAPQQVQNYVPIPASQSNRPAPQYDPQNHARYVAQQQRSRQDQMQRQQMQQANFYHQSSMEENLAYSAKVIEQANADNPKRQFNIEDFLSKKD